MVSWGKKHTHTKKWHHKIKINTVCYFPSCLAVLYFQCDERFESSEFIFILFLRFTSVSSTGPDMPPLIPPWWAPRSWRCKGATWAVTRTLKTSEATFTCSPTPLISPLSDSLTELTWSDVPVILFYRAHQSISKLTENIFTCQMKQYFHIDLYTDGTWPPFCFKTDKILCLMWNELLHS